jgi:hypothetical protein
MYLLILVCSKCKTLAGHVLIKVKCDCHLLVSSDYMASSQPLSLHELESTFGVLFVGYVVAMVLYGFTFFRVYLHVIFFRIFYRLPTETYVYFSRYGRDALWIKFMVRSVFSLALHAHCVTQVAGLWYTFSLFYCDSGLNHFLVH